MMEQWSTAKRIAHALGWLVVVGVPTAMLVGTLMALFENPDALPRDWLTPSIACTISTAVQSALAVSVVAAGIFVWLTSIRRRWSLKWAGILVLLACVPFCAAATVMVATIGIGKLIIWWVGRGGVVSASRLHEPAAVNPPQGLVEYAKHE